MGNMNNKRIAVLESRFGEHLVDLLAKQGAIPLHAPALAEQPDLDAEAIRRLIEEWRARPFKLAIFQTGVGSRALFKAAEKLGLPPHLLALLPQILVAV